MSDTQTYHDHERTSEAVQEVMQRINKQKHSNKRKRDASDYDGDGDHSAPRHAPTLNVHRNGLDGSNVTQGIFNNDTNPHDFSNIGQELARHVAVGMPSTAAAALAAGMPHLTVPRPTELSFPSGGSSTDAERHIDSSFEMGVSDGDQNHHTQGAPYNLSAYQGDAAAQLQVEGAGGSKPAVGSDEWHKVRRDNHKEVERRRRETINEGINELAKIVPGCEKNKGSILQRGVQYITQLKDNEARNIEKWTIEKLLTDQAIAELSTSNDRLKTEAAAAFKEAERWKKTCQEAGLKPKDDDTGGIDDNNDDNDDNT